MTSIDHFDYINIARQAEQNSMHPTHKVGAVIIGTDNNGFDYTVSKPNFWPEPLENSLGRYKKLGNASTTVHAEVAAICAAPATQNSTIYVTDLPCPNCAKIMAEAGINNIYIDANTHNTLLGKKMKMYFDVASTPILQSAGVSVYEVNDILETITPIITSTADTNIIEQRPVTNITLENSDINQSSFHRITENTNTNTNTNTNFAACYAKNTLGQYRFIFAQPQISIGLPPDKAYVISTHQDKYEPILQPINRLLLTCARHGLNIDKNYIYSSQTPTSREFVNIIGTGYTSLYIADRTKCRDKWGLKALSQLEEHNIIDTPP